jgi:hypothetical protein
MANLALHQFIDENSEALFCRRRVIGAFTNPNKRVGAFQALKTCLRMPTNCGPVVKTMRTR